MPSLKQNLQEGLLPVLEEEWKFGAQNASTSESDPSFEEVVPSLVSSSAGDFSDTDCLQEQQQRRFHFTALG
ncbi:hypothetical protein AVEN_129426-1, partial [Araneus ventricosus]